MALLHADSFRVRVGSLPVAISEKLRNCGVCRVRIVGTRGSEPAQGVLSHRWRTLSFLRVGVPKLSHRRLYVKVGP
jgi:hypothetical protein